jgi:nucleosome assembly protein 1-like 1
VPTESFFNFFDPPKPPQDEEDDASSDIEERLELDYQLGEDIKEKLIPRAIDWFTGEALQYENIEDYDEGEFEDEDDEDEDELSDDRDEDEESDDEVCSLPQPGLNSVLTCAAERRHKTQAGGC